MDSRVVRSLALLLLFPTVLLAQVTLTPLPPLLLQPGSTDLAAGDFDENGTIDLVVCRRANDDVQLYLGDGLGGYTVASTHSVGDEPVAIAVADLDANGHLDVITANEDGHSLTILDGDGLGGFTATDVPLLSEVRDLVVGDFTGNGAVDLAIIHESGHPGAGDAIHIYVANAMGVYQLGPQAPVGLDAMQLAAADMDGDADLDLVVACRGLVPQLPGGLYVVRNDGNMFFLTFEQSIGFFSTVAVADVNLDDRPDALVTQVSDVVCDDHLGYFQNDGTGMLVSMPVASGQCGPFPAAAGDLDQDGHPDFVYTDDVDQLNPVNGTVSVLRGSPGGLLAADPVLPAGLAPGPLLVTDLDGDSDPDVAVLNEQDGTLSVYIAGGSISFRRGDANTDGSVLIDDAIRLLSALFAPGADPLACPDAADITDDGSVNIADAVAVLQYLFQMGSSPAPPFPDCGSDPGVDALPVCAYPPAGC